MANKTWFYRKPCG